MLYVQNCYNDSYFFQLNYGYFWMAKAEMNKLVKYQKLMPLFLNIYHVFLQPCQSLSL